ncbi:PREDICTED: UDP-glycosyltransferase 82A1 [Tarenaya hassleriana]|uniref:UDP-glycosyltransferase 82A1 n=1 Tax=Tarenaya hassleriana TaxID=28532 RepID=UPI00053C092A|nr:PREDICTED: UDP-glycosyltransferase 82A1 [Tarenaya hassleriana]
MKMIEKPKVIFIPYPAQGHVTPMLHLASAFLSRGFSPVVLTPEPIHRRISSANLGREIDFIPLSNGPDCPDASPGDFFSVENAMENVMPSQLEGILLRAGARVGCVVVDLLASWAIRVAGRCGVPAAGFWPAMLASYRVINAIPELVRTGVISRSGRPRQPESQIFLPEQPVLTAGELPWLIGTPEAQKGRFEFWERTLERSKTLRWILVNSFKSEYDHHLIGQNTSYKRRNEEDKENGPRIIHVGPLNKIHADTTLTKNPSFWEEDRTCLDWLKQQKPNSVIYVSFGSWVSPIGESKIKSLALALESSGKPFLWALKPAWQESLPKGFMKRVTTRVKNQGKIVNWAPQREILKNDIVGCYLTHCGWNSTMEAVECSRKMLCYPVAGDQFVNCGYIVDVWRVGDRVLGFGEKEVEEGVTRVMEDDEMGERLKKLREKVMGMASESDFSFGDVFVEYFD